ncbi:hypothetical protein Bpfe_003495 [Biomphalaria pfeifferi]|uniref:Uncharacterized protein n=1 Tax=Biomphalaria pfeifferi TaxID=112525 RepID=A0AAD8C5P4_BIOPF|nr:hypothetical protein Bpfe_003495 [Biomphalaria pfeifferi]
MIVNVANDHVVEITRVTPVHKEWTKSECKGNGQCNHKTCNHIAIRNDVCVFEFSYQISIIHPPSRLLDYTTITDLANYLLRCIFLRSSLVLAARVARVHSKFKPNNDENLMSHFGEVFQIVVDVNGTMDQKVEWKIKNGLHQFFEETSLIRLYANENAPKNGSFVSTYQNSTKGTV